MSEEKIVEHEEVKEESKYEKILAKIEELQEREIREAKAEDAEHRQEETGKEEQEREGEVRLLVKQSIEELKQELLEIEREREQRLLLERTFGKNYKENLKELANDTGLSEDTLVRMASENPKALKKLLPDTGDGSFLFDNESKTEVSHTYKAANTESNELVELFRKTRGFMSPQQYSAIVAKWEDVSKTVGKRDFSPFPEDIEQ